MGKVATVRLRNASPITQPPAQSGQRCANARDARSTGRVAAVLALVVLAAVALHGYLPGTQRPAHGQPPDNPAAQVVVVAMLGMSLGIVAIAVIVRVRGPRVVSASSASADGTSGGSRDGWGRPTSRALLDQARRDRRVLSIFVPPAADFSGAGTARPAGRFRSGSLRNGIQHHHTRHQHRPATAAAGARRQRREMRWNMSSVWSR